MVNGISNLKTRKISIARGLELCKYRIIFVNVRIIGKSWKTHSESTKTGGGIFQTPGSVITPPIILYWLKSYAR
jgi:hypothetical protein